MFIRIVEASELTPELSLRASDYLKETPVSSAAIQRLETGRKVPTRAALRLIEEADGPPTVEVGQLWEIEDSRGRDSSDGGFRRVEVKSISDTHAEVENTRTEHRTIVRLSAFNGRTKKGYRLVSSDGS